MQHVYKKFFLNSNDMFDLYNISKFFIKTVVISLIFSSCSILTEEKKTYIKPLIIIKNNDFEKDKTLKKQKNIQNFKKILNESNFILSLSHNNLVKKTIYIKKKSNFFKSANASGLSLSDIKNIIKAIEWQINFRKLNTNSTFDLIYLQKKINIKKLK